MKRRNLLKSFCVIIIFFVSIISFPSESYSESVFMKNGSISEGKITGEDDKKIILTTGSGRNLEIERKDIIRILIHSRYKDKIYITQRDGITFEGYIVNEDNENYVLRTNLDSQVEIKIPRAGVETISKKKASQRILPPSVYSSVFTEEGGIIDCRIIKETANLIEIQAVDGERKVIPKNMIIRIQYNNSYKDKKILNKTDGTKIEGYIVEENSRSYTYRTELYSPLEIKIFKSNLKNISKK